MLRFVLPDRHEWLRVADPAWSDPIDTSYSVASGVSGRWNPPGAWATLYLSYDLDTARLQIRRMLEGTPFDPNDLTDDAYDLVAVTLPDQQTALDVVSDEGVAAVGLPASYPPHQRVTGSRTKPVCRLRPTPTPPASTGSGAARLQPSTAPAANSPGGQATGRRPGIRRAERTAIGADLESKRLLRYSRLTAGCVPSSMRTVSAWPE